MLENSKFLNRLRNGHLEKSAVTGLFHPSRSPTTAKMPLKVHLRLRFQNLGKPRTAGLCGRAAGACDCGPLSCAFIERPSPLEKLSCKVRFFAQTHSRKYRQKVTATTLFQITFHRGFSTSLKAGDTTLVGDIQHLTINGVEKNFYSFATKYCSHHNPLEYPIYDSYVDRVLRHYRDQDGFAEFKNEELKDYARFKELLIQFREFYGLQEYDLKQIDKYIWQLGKDYFPKNYGK